MEVIMGCRDEDKGAMMAGKLQERGLSVIAHQLDMDKPEDLTEIVSFVAAEYGNLDVLVNNAAIFIDPDWAYASGNWDIKTIADKSELMAAAFKTNVIGPHILIEVAAELMMKNRYGRIVNVSSIMGQLESMQGGYHSYRITKTALSAVTRIFAAELKEFGILVNAACPGWTQTKMGGAEAPQSVDQATEVIMKLATLPADGPTGKLFRKRAMIEW